MIDIASFDYRLHVLKVKFMAAISLPLPPPFPPPPQRGFLLSVSVLYNSMCKLLLYRMNDTDFWWHECTSKLIEPLSLISQTFIFFHWVSNCITLHVTWTSFWCTHLVTCSSIKGTITGHLTSIGTTFCLVFVFSGLMLFLTHGRRFIFSWNEHLFTHEYLVS